MSARKIAIEILIKFEKNKTYLNHSLNAYFKSNSISKLDVAFVTELVYGTVEKIFTLDFFIRRYSSVPLRKMSIQVKNILRISFYQLVYMNKIPHSAICNEAVNICKLLDKRNCGFVNAVLRSAIRDNANLVIPKFNKKQFHSKTQYLSIKYSLPEILVEKLIAAYGEKVANDIFSGFNNKKEMTIRTNTQKIESCELMDLLNQEGYKCQKGKISKDAIVVLNPIGLFSSKLFEDGLFYVQDEGAMFITECAKLEAVEHAKNIKVLDMCAAPGGKSTHAAQILKGDGQITSCDIYEHKLSLINDNAKRLGINNITTKLANSAEFDDSCLEKYDVVFADVPCSGTGVIGSKPEIKLHIDSGTFDQLAEVQYEILENAFKYCKPQGTIIYSTCSIMPEENEKLIEKFISMHQDCVKVAPLNEDKKVVIEYGFAEEYGLTIFPHLNATDGFYVAKLIKLA